MDTHENLMTERTASSWGINHIKSHFGDSLMLLPSLKSLTDLVQVSINSQLDLCKSKLDSLPDLGKSKFSSLTDLCKSKLNSLPHLCKSTSTPPSPGGYSPKLARLAQFSEFPSFLMFISISPHLLFLRFVSISPQMGSISPCELPTSRK